MAKVAAPPKGGFDAWKQGLLTELRRVTFRCLPERIPAALVIGQAAGPVAELQTEPGIKVRLSRVARPESNEAPVRVLLGISRGEEGSTDRDWARTVSQKGEALFLIEPRGIGETRWTRKNPPNYVERSEALLGRTVDTGRVRDVIATARYLHQNFQGKASVMGWGVKTRP